MSQIRTAKAADVGAFPGSKFVINDTPPIAQCQETQIDDPDPSWTIGEYTITPLVSVAAIDLTGKKVTIFGSLSDDGTYNILSHVGQLLLTDHQFIGVSAGADTRYHDVGQTYLTRNESSFTKYIRTQSKAHTTKGGQLYTDITDPPMNDACSDTWNPQ